MLYIAAMSAALCSCAKEIVMDAGDESLVVVAAIASKDYDAYLRDAIYFKRLSESSDLSSIYNRENIFSNIHGGLGIFGAYTTTYLGWFYGYNSTEWEYLEKPFD